MRPVGNPTPLHAGGSRHIEAGDAVEGLLHKPKPQKEKGGNASDCGENPQGNPGENLCVRISQDVGSHDTGNRPTGTQRRHSRAGGKIPLSQGCHYTTSQVKNQVFDVTEAVFYVVAKNPEEKHIAGDVCETAVQELGSN
jgi:hypothetical protein